jgi:hypothetical protein
MPSSYHRRRMLIVSIAMVMRCIHAFVAFLETDCIKGIIHRKCAGCTRHGVLCDPLFLPEADLDTFFEDEEGDIDNIDIQPEET